MSALPPKADIDEMQLDVRFVPSADIPSLDHFVGERRATSALMLCVNHRASAERLGLAARCASD
jgi:hypothetical protein